MKYVMKRSSVKIKITNWIFFIMRTWYSSRKSLKRNWRCTLFSIIPCCRQRIRNGRPVNGDIGNKVNSDLKLRVWGLKLLNRVWLYCSKLILNKWGLRITLPCNWVSRDLLSRKLRMLFEVRIWFFNCK